MTTLEHLRREREELKQLSEDARCGGDLEMAIWYEHDAAQLGVRIDTMELADGMALGAPVDGRAA